jgi:hypothetical protein
MSLPKCVNDFAAWIDMYECISTLSHDDMVNTLMRNISGVKNIPKDKLPTVNRLIDEVCAIRAQKLKKRAAGKTKTIFYLFYLFFIEIYKYMDAGVVKEKVS